MLGDRLWQNQAAVVRTGDRYSLRIILIESCPHVQHRSYHRQKLVLM
ncbi:cryptochrome/photolyase family protein [Microcoleus sp. LEGE 07076]